MMKRKLKYMNKNIKKIVYYFIIIVLFIIFDKLIYLIPDNKSMVINNTLLLENQSLKNELNEITKLKYNNYDYILGKITYKNLYNSDSYFIQTSENIDNKIVLNEKGMIGILKNNMLSLVKDLNISIKINDNLGILKENKINIVHANYNIGDKIYTSGIGSINDNFLIGYVKEVKELSEEDIIIIDYLTIESSYVVILK